MFLMSGAKNLEVRSLGLVTGLSAMVFQDYLGNLTL